jgi:hypothetical protein
MDAGGIIKTRKCAKSNGGTRAGHFLKYPKIKRAYRCRASGRAYVGTRQ